MLTRRPGAGPARPGPPAHGIGTGIGTRGRAAPGCAAWRHASATRTASALPGTRCTRAHQAPAAAARAVTDTVASSDSANGRGVPSGAASSRPRNRLRDAPISTGNGRARPPSELISSRWVSRAQLCSGRLAKPRPGSSTIMAGSTPAASPHRPGGTVPRSPPPPHPGRRPWNPCCGCDPASASPRRALRRPRRAGASGDRPGPPLTSLTSRAPASRARSATSARIVSTLTGTPAATRPWMTGPHPAQFLLGGDPLRTRAGGLPAHVHDVRALRDGVPGRARSRPPRRTTDPRRRRSPG